MARGVDLAIEDGELVALIGGRAAASRPCCASLRVLSRRHQAEVSFGDGPSTGFVPARRNLAMVFHPYALIRTSPYSTILPCRCGCDAIRARHAPAGQAPPGRARTRTRDPREGSSGLPLSLNFNSAQAQAGQFGRPAAARCGRTRHRRRRSGLCSTSRCPTWTPICGWIAHRTCPATSPAEATLST